MTVLPSDITVPQQGSTPVAIYMPEPWYPPALLDQNMSGRVELEFTVDKQGAVKNISVLSSSDDRFVEPSLAAARIWRFKPGTTSVRVRMPVVFNFNGPTAIYGQGSKALDVEPVPVYSPNVVGFVSAGWEPIRGHVRLVFVVDENGEVRDVMYLWASDNRLIKPAVDTISAWRFEPAKVNGRAVPVRRSMVVEF